MINIKMLLIVTFLLNIFWIIPIETCAEEGLRLKKVGTEKVYFTHNGKPLLSFGGLSDFIFYAAKDAINFQLWADWAEEHGINHVRAYPPLSWKYIEKFAEDNGGSVENVLFPYEETETGSRQFDLTKFNEDYWRRFRKKCEYLAKKDIIIHLLMWNGWQLREGDKNWGGHFFNPKNNVNSFTEHLGGELDNRFKIYHSVADDNTELVNAQKAWFSKLIEETHDLGNVYFDLVHEIAEHCGEWKKTTKWIEEMALTVREQFKEINPNGMVILGMDAGGLEGFSSNDIGMPKPGSQIELSHSGMLHLTGRMVRFGVARLWQFLLTMAAGE